jgi:hypothetical protein
MSDETIVDPLCVQPAYVEGVKAYRLDGITHLAFYAKMPDDPRYNTVMARLVIPMNRLPDIASALLEATHAPAFSEDGARLN